MLLDEIVCGEGGAEILSAMRRTVLRKVGRRFKGEIGIGDQFSKRQQ